MNEEKKRILLADSSVLIRDKILSSKHAQDYHFEIATTGPECLQKMETFQPHLVLLNLLMPQIHGIEILRKIKGEEKTKEIGVFICTAKMMIQDYHYAMEFGADYFLEKPFGEEKLFSLIEEYFAKTLKPAPFPKKPHVIEETKQQLWYTPSLETPKNYLKLWGTRGSITVSGSEYTHFGGNTCCAELHYGEDIIIFDAGTGIRPLGFHLKEIESRTLHLFIGHTHWDHILGFPFFEPLYDERFTIHIWAPITFGKSSRDLFTDILAYEFFPIRLDEVEAKLEFHEIRDLTPVKIGSVEIDFHYTYHPGVTYGFRITTPHKTIGYITDNEMLIGFHGSPNDLRENHYLLDSYRTLLTFLSGCDLLIHEAQYTPQEYPEKIGWGHSSISNAAVIAKHTQVPHWLVTHHDPQHTDQDLLLKHELHKKILRENKIPTEVSMAYDGITIPL